jgi:ankyrin repeat protein
MRKHILAGAALLLALSAQSRGQDTRAAATLRVPSRSAVVADAAMKGDLASVRRLIQQGGNVNVAQGDGMTALHWGAERGDAAMVAALLAAKANVKAVTRIGEYTPLHIAAKTGNPAVVTALLNAGADAKAVTTSGATALHFAAAAGDTTSINAFADQHADVNAKESEWGQTPLIFAASAGRAPAIRALVKRGADLGLRTALMNLQEQTALEQAATRKRNAVLVSWEPEKHKNDTLAAPTAMAGAPMGQPGVNIIPPIDSSASAGAYGGGGRGARGGGGTGGAGGAAGPARAALPQPKGPFTPAQLQAAIDSGRALLLAGTATKGPVTEEVDTINGGVAGFANQVGGVGGLTALHHAVRQGNIDAVVALIESGAPINEPTASDKTTPLLMATINGQFDVAMVLLKYAANPNMAATNGLTPLYATINTAWSPHSRFPQPQTVEFQKTPYLELMTALLKAGANPDARIVSQMWYFVYNNCGSGNCGLENIDGTTPFWRAAYAVDVDAMKLLVRHGADASLPSVRNPANAAGGRGGAGGGRGGAGGGGGGVAPPQPALDPAIDSASKAVPPGIGVYAIHAAAGVGYGNGFAGNAHRHAPDGWMPAMKYLVEELHADVNQRDNNGMTPLHHAASRGDNDMILYLVSKGADVKAVSRRGQTTVDLANGPVQRLRPFPETIALLEKLGAKNSHKCVSC